MIKRAALACLLMGLPSLAVAQDVDTPEPVVPGDVYDKPYLFEIGKTALGGYAEAHFRFEREEGVTEELSFVPKRFNLFTFTPVGDYVRVAAELEIEEGGEEIKVELAMIEIEFSEYFILRGGILLSPLGRFNIAHDSPANDLTDRPLTSEGLLGATLSETGFGFLGYVFPFGDARITYELYLVNGFTDGVINDSDETRLAAGRANFEDNNNFPSVVGRIGFAPTEWIELGISGHNGPYNTFNLEGVDVTNRRDASAFVVDLDAFFFDERFELKAEYARVNVQIPQSLQGIYASSQQGFYAQLNYHFFYGIVPIFDDSVMTAVVRFEGVDFDTSLDGNSHMRLTTGLNFRPIEETVLKLDYQYNWVADRANNAVPSAAVLVSLATYF